MDKQEVYQLIEEHYRSNFDSTVKKMTRKCGGHAQAEDVVQETYARALRYWDSFDVMKSFDDWFNGILHKSFLSHRKKERNTLTVTEEIPEVSSSVGDRIAVRDIRKFVDAKPDNERTILDLFFFKEYKPQDIEQLVPLSGNAIRKVVSRFKEEMRKEYDKA